MRCSHCLKMKKLYPDRKINVRHHLRNCPQLKDTVCLNCKQTGHTANYCTAPKKTCILCGHNGHDKTNCGYKSQILFYDFPVINVDITKINWKTL